MRVVLTILLIALSMFAFIDTGKAEHKTQTISENPPLNLPSLRVREIIANMIRLQYPGVSTYSRINVDPAICLLPKQDRPRHCTKPGPLCGPPGEDILGIQGCTRSESWNEAMLRYREIAESIHRVAKRTSFNNCDVGEQINKCNVLTECKTKKCEDQCAVKSYKSCRKLFPWRGKQVELENMMAVVSEGESGYRRDIQLGIGHEGLGDCAWEDPETHKRVKAWTDGGRPILTTCQSFCLAQINFNRKTEIMGYQATELIGEDPGSLDKCFTVSAEYLSRWRGMCLKKSWLKRTGGDWAKGTFTGYGTGSTCGPAPWKRWKRKSDGTRVHEYVYRNTTVKGKCTFKNECMKWMESRPTSKMANGLIKLGSEWELMEDPRFKKRAADYWRITNYPKALREKELAVYAPPKSGGISDIDILPTSFHSQGVGLPE